MLVGIGKYGNIALSISLFFSVFWIGLVILKTTDEKYTHYEKVASFIQYDTGSGGYFIEKNISGKLKMIYLFKNKATLEV